MELLLTVPLTIGRAKMELLPVRMDQGFPSKDSELWVRFLKSGGARIPLSPRDAEQIQMFMTLNGSEAVSEDGEVAFTIAGDSLVECDPDVCCV